MPINARAALKSYRPGVLTDRHKVAKDVLVRSEYYNDFMRQFDIHSVLMFRLAVVGMDTVILNLHRTPRAGQFGNSEIHLANTLLPHLIRAIDIGQKLAAAQALSDDLANAHSPHGLFVVDGEGRVRQANPAGQALLGGAGPLRVYGRAPHCGGAREAHGRLEALIRPGDGQQTPPRAPADRSRYVSSEHNAARCR